MLIFIRSLVRSFAHSQAEPKMLRLVSRGERSYESDLFLNRYLLLALPLMICSSLGEAVLHNADTPELLLLTGIVMGYLN